MTGERRCEVAVVGAGMLGASAARHLADAGCVYAESRRKGLQSAFIRFRLAQAASRGLRYATIGSAPGGPTERNALRAGFSAAYTQIGLCQD